jgi:hypothetical protein
MEVTPFWDARVRDVFPPAELTHRLKPSALVRLGSTASTLFIGNVETNFSQGSKILFETLCAASIHACLEANQPLSHNDSNGVQICANDCLKSKQTGFRPEALTAPGGAPKKSAARVLLSPPSVLISTVFCSLPKTYDARSCLQVAFPFRGR